MTVLGKGLLSGLIAGQGKVVLEVCCSNCHFSSPVLSCIIFQVDESGSQRSDPGRPAYTCNLPCSIYNRETGCMSWWFQRGLWDQCFWVCMPCFSALHLNSSETCFIQLVDISPCAQVSFTSYRNHIKWFRRLLMSASYM